MKTNLRNSIWFVAFPAVGILSAFIAMGQALGGGLNLSVANTSYSIGRGLVAGLIFGFVFLLFWLGNHVSSTKSRFIELSVFGTGWYLAFYIYIAAVAAV